MERKLMRQGSGTLVVSLPAKWVRKYDLNKGDSIIFKEENDRIILSTGKEYAHIKKKTVHLKTTNKTAIKWIISVAHKTGYDELEVLFDDPEAIPIIQDLIKAEVHGYMIMEQSDKRCVLRVVSQALESEFDNSLRRAFLVGLSLAESSLEMIKEKKFETLSTLLHLESTNNQLVNFCELILNKNGYKEPNKTSYMYIVVWLLEKIVDEYREIIKRIVK
ncbi:AbrB/MazE/SpoVT family DNA-binding domain-containing protein, partial [Nanoarchaeota archaeon]